MKSENQQSKGEERINTDEKNMQSPAQRSIWRFNPDSLSNFYPEIERYAKHCRLINCKHEEEFDCAVKKAVKIGSIRADRLKSYIFLKKGFENKNDIFELKQSQGIEEKIPVVKAPLSELGSKFKILVNHDQKILNIEHQLVKYSMEEKIKCLELICKLPGLELLDLSNNGKIPLIDAILDLPNLKKVRVDNISITTEKEKDLIEKLKNKGVNVVIYEISDF